MEPLVHFWKMHRIFEKFQIKVLKKSLKHWINFWRCFGRIFWKKNQKESVEKFWTHPWINFWSYLQSTSYRNPLRYHWQQHVWSNHRQIVVRIPSEITEWFIPWRFFRKASGSSSRKMVLLFSRDFFRRFQDVFKNSFSSLQEFLQ